MLFQIGICRGRVPVINNSSAVHLVKDGSGAGTYRDFPTATFLGKTHTRSH